MALRAGTPLEQTLAPYGHESNSAIEHGNKVGEGLLRVLRLAVEARLGWRIPYPRAVLARLAEHTGGTTANWDT